MIANETHLNERIESELTEALASGEDIIEEIADRIGSIIKEKDDRIDELEDRIDELEDELDEERDTRSADIEGCHNRISNVEDEVVEADSDNTHSTDDKSIASETALEDVVALPDGVAASELTANQHRARFIASDIVDYTKSTPKGRMIAASDIGTVLRAGTDCRGRTETVSRVIDFLDSLGGAQTEIKRRNGERYVYVDDSLAERLVRHASNGCGRTQGNHTVVTGTTG